MALEALVSQLPSANGPLAPLFAAASDSQDAGGAGGGPEEEGAGGPHRSLLRAASKALSLRAAADSSLAKYKDTLAALEVWGMGR